MTGTTDLPLAGRTVAVTAERRAADQIGLLERRGAHVLHLPTVHTVDLRADVELRSRTEDVVASPPDWTLATTGFGMRWWFEAADDWGMGDDLVAALATTRVVARGPKARSACRQRGLEPVWMAPEESMAEVVAWVSGQEGIGTARVLVQLFDPDDHPSTEALRAVAGAVEEIPLYRWHQPAGDGADRLVQAILDGAVDAVTFTSQPAVRFLLDAAAAAGREGDVVAALNAEVVPVCVGPVCAEAGRERGVEAMRWPEPYRLAPMVRLVESALADRD